MSRLCAWVVQARCGVLVVKDKNKLTSVFLQTSVECTQGVETDLLQDVVVSKVSFDLCACFSHVACKQCGAQSLGTGDGGYTGCFWCSYTEWAISTHAPL